MYVPRILMERIRCHEVFSLYMDIIDLVYSTIDIVYHSWYNAVIGIK